MLAINDNGGANPHREKVINKLSSFLRTIPEEASEGERLEKLSAFFTKVAKITECFGDNFTLNNFIERGHGDPAKRDMACLSRMLEGNEESVLLLDAIRAEMAKSALTRVNGTSLAFNECVEKCNEELIRLKRAYVLMDKLKECPELTLARL